MESQSTTSSNPCQFGAACSVERTNTRKILPIPKANCTTAARNRHAFLAALRNMQQHTVDPLRTGHCFVLLSRPFVPSDVQPGNAENKLLVSWAVHEWVVCSQPTGDPKQLTLSEKRFDS
jgi:hypothetical protein